jgi:sRNA-binding regulator protein Hfq
MQTELKGPAHNQFKKFITDNKLIEIKLLNDEMITGKLIWVDQNSIFVETEARTQMLIMKSSIMYVYAKCPEGVGNTADPQCNQ